MTGRRAFSPQAAAILVVLVGIDSLHFVFARLLLPHIPPTSSAFYVLAIGTLEVVALALIRRRLDFKVLRDNWIFFLGIGVLVSVSMRINYQAVEFVDPGAATLLSKASIIFGLGLSLFWLKERLAPVQGVGALVAIAGVLIITFQPGDYFRLGSLLILASAFMYALHAALVKRYGEQLDLLTFFAFRMLCTMVLLLVFALAGGRLVWPAGPTWLLILLAGTLDIAISRLLYYLVLRRFTMSLHTIILMLSPAVAVGWSWLLFGSIPTWQEAIGGLAVLAGVAIVTRAPARASKDEAAIGEDIWRK
ncbi:MAG: DMT family transporter [Anaerolineae bacterium]|nr:DMT family transporter [Anaerolineae bacterium]